MDEKRLPGAAIRDGYSDRPAARDDRAPGFFEGCLLVLRRSLRKVFILPGESTGQPEGYQRGVRTSPRVVHERAYQNRPNLERDLSIWYDWLDGLAPSYLARKHNISRSRIYQILKRQAKDAERMI